MTSLKATKRALLSSVLALFLCFAMLLGTTYAWFTDSATSSGNTITSGVLDVELYKWTKNDAGEVVGTALSELAKAGKDTSVFSADVLWEPGHTQVAYLSIKNNGSLDLKYRVAVIVTAGADVDGDKADITEVMFYEITPDKKFGEVTAWSGINAKQVKLGNNNTDAEDVTLLAGKNGNPGEEHFFALSVHMDEEAGNKYQNETVTFDIVVLAGQLASETDSFGPNYDKYAGYHGIGFAPSPLVTGASAVEIPVRGEDGYKDASINVPMSAVADGYTDDLIAYVNEVDYVGNFAVPAGSETLTYDVTVEGIKEGNTTPIKVMLKLPVDLDPTTVSVYHYDEPINNPEYNPNTGYVTFYTTSFSPFTLIHDADSKYQPAPALPEGLPVAGVVNSPVYENVDLPWGSYGVWSPTDGLEAKLEAAYTFSCTETLDEAEQNKFANWYCDFYVELDKDLGANQIFLGGNYGSFGWVGFHNGDLTLEANTEIPLLGSVTSNPWTYLDVAQNVGTFICGVGDVNNALAGATFTVTLRLTNPENEAEFYNIAQIKYVFGTENITSTVVSTQTALNDITTTGGTVILEAGEYKMPSNQSSTADLTIVGTKDTVVDVTLGAYMDSANVTFKGVTIKTSTGYANGNGSDYAALYTPNVTYIDCTFVGPMRVGRDGAKFVNCTFTNLGNDYIWTYGNDVTFEGCTFNTDGKAILVYSDGGNEVSKVTVKNCIFNSTQGAKAGAIANQNCAAIEIHNYGNGVNLVTEGNTYDSNFSGEWRIKTYENGKPQVIVNGTEYTQIAIDGKLMTIDANKNVTVQ